MALVRFVKNNYTLIILFTIFSLYLFFHFYDLEGNLFGWDQVGNAWKAKDMIVNHKFPLLGVPAKGGGGFLLGPGYYYFIYPFYLLTNLDPIASGLIAGATSVITFFVYYLVFKKLFSQKMALIAVFINTVSYYVIGIDRTQWNVNLIAPISLLIFFVLYKILIGNVKYLLALGILLGISLHIHFTSIFYFVIIVLSLPFFPRNIQALRYSFLSILFFVALLMPNILAEFISKKSNTSSIINYLGVYYHGFHLQRVYQLVNDAFIEFGNVLFIKILKPLKFLLLPGFLYLYLKNGISRSRLIFSYLVIFWFLVPWLVLSTYKGEISDYYFMSTMPIVILIISYLTLRAFEYKNFIIKAGIICFWTIYSVTNITYFVNEHFNSYSKEMSLRDSRAKTEKAIQERAIIEFSEGSPTSFLYYVYNRNEKK